MFSLPLEVPGLIPQISDSRISLTFPSCSFDENRRSDPYSWKKKARCVGCTIWRCSEQAFRIFVSLLTLFIACICCQKLARFVSLLWSFRLVLIHFASFYRCWSSNFSYVAGFFPSAAMTLKGARIEWRSARYFVVTNLVFRTVFIVKLILKDSKRRLPTKETRVDKRGCPSFSVPARIRSPVSSILGLPTFFLFYLVPSIYNCHEIHVTSIEAAI